MSECLSIRRMDIHILKVECLYTSWNQIQNSRSVTPHISDQMTLNFQGKLNAQSIRLQNSSVPNNCFIPWCAEYPETGISPLASINVQRAHSSAPMSVHHLPPRPHLSQLDPSLLSLRRLGPPGNTRILAPRGRQLLRKIPSCFKSNLVTLGTWILFLHSGLR